MINGTSSGFTIKNDGHGQTKWIELGNGKISGYIVSTDEYDKGACYGLMGEYLAVDEKTLWKKYNINPLLVHNNIV